MKRGRGRLPSPAPPAAPPAGERAPYRSKQDERSFQQEVVDALDSKYPAVLYNASPNGVWYGRDRALAAIIARTVKKAGTKNGVPDLHIIEVGALGQPGAWAELKQGTQPTSPDQLKFHEKLRARGHEVAVIKTVAAFEVWLQAYLYGAGSSESPVVID